MIRARSFAKINLGIEVLKKRADGYHQIRTLFQSIDLYDVLEFRRIRGNGVILEGDDPSVPWTEDNLIHKAAVLIKRQRPSTGGVHIKVKKTIPPGKGLGGGSSNAAVTLMVLNRLWEAGLSQKHMASLAGRIGADVPYFLMGGLCLGEGRGDRITPLEGARDWPCLLVLPSVSIMTAEVYRNHTNTLTSPRKDSKIIRFLKTGDPAGLTNDLEETIFRSHPQLKAIKKRLLRRNALLSLVSGSGSAVFGLFSDEEKAAHALAGLEDTGAAYIVKPIPRETYSRCVRTGV